MSDLIVLTYWFAFILITGPFIPYTLHVFIASDGTWGEELILENNSDLLAEVESVRWPKREYGTFPSARWPEKRKNIIVLHSNVIYCTYNCRFYNCAISLRFCVLE